MGLLVALPWPRQSMGIDFCGVLSVWHARTYVTEPNTPATAGEKGSTRNPVPSDNQPARQVVGNHHHLLPFLSHAPLPIISPSAFTPDYGGSTIHSIPNQNSTIITSRPTPIQSRPHPIFCTTDAGGLIPRTAVAVASTGTMYKLSGDA